MSDDSALSVPEKTRGKEKKKKGEKHTSNRVGGGGGGKWSAYSKGNT